MITLLSLIPLAAWIYLIAFRGRFWLSGPELDSEIAAGPVKVVAVVPARDEAESIQECMASLLKQQSVGKLSIILVDDNSTDGTAEIAASVEGGERLTIIRGAPLPAGWSGKVWAVHQGLSQNDAKTADYVLLTDADIWHAPGHIASLVSKAEADGLDMVSEMVHLNCVTVAEKALIPAFVFFFQMLYPFAWVADPASRVAGAAGGTMLVRRSMLDRIDGVSRIRDCLIDDCALAREIKGAGGRLWLGHAQDTVSMRVYRGWPDVWNMIARTAYVQLKHSSLLLLGCLFGMGAIFCVAPVLAIFSSGVARSIGIATWLMMALAFQPTLHRYKRSPLWGISLPAISIFYLGATIASANRHYSGRGGGWKNRVYPESRTE